MEALQGDSLRASWGRTGKGLQTRFEALVSTRSVRDREVLEDPIEARTYEFYGQQVINERLYWHIA